ncbi:hypothetical protein D0784_00735 [Vibrio campbellii]|jgi:hypothetical protein|nr:hypothetical protein D0784_00735 [Vibrio campbellii]PAW09700.1 hypothetical protein B6K85_16330 [Vibrio sp. V1B]
MNYDKRWMSWREFLESSGRLSDCDDRECKNKQQFKHLPISMTAYYDKSWPGWHDYLEQTKK